MYCVIRLRETIVPPLDDPFVISLVFVPLWCFVSLCVPIMGVTEIL